MPSLNPKLLWPTFIALCLLLVGAGYAMGKRASTPRSTVAAEVAPDSSSIAQSLFKRCSSLTADAKMDCYQKPLDSLAAVGEVRAAMGTLNRLEALDQDAKRDGHVYAHGIGITAGKRGGDLAKTFAMCDESNQSGCYHGVIQAYFDDAKKIGPEEVNGLCRAFRGETQRWILFQCVHGEGHGLTMIYNHDLPKALEGCDLLKDDWDRQSCYGGAFMENIVNVTNPHHPAHGMAEHTDHSAMDDMPGMSHEKSTFKAMDPNDKLYPCSKLADRYLGSCYQMQTSIILYFNHGDMKDAAQTCDKAPGAMKFVCYQSLGRDISSYSLQNHQTAISMCSMGARKFQPWCYVGLVKNLIDLNARAEDGMSLCREITAEDNKTKCYEAVGEQIGTLHADSQARWKDCSSSEPAYVDVCLYGARVTADVPAVLLRVNKEAFDAYR